MKRAVIYMSMITLAFIAFSCGDSSVSGNGNNDSIAQNGKAEITFEEETHNFGDIREGEQVSHIFKFKNTGDGELVLSRVTASCGCTTPEWTRDPVAPGESGQIKVAFNSEGREGHFRKTVTVLYHDKKAVLVIKGYIKSN